MGAAPTQFERPRRRPLARRWPAWVIGGGVVLGGQLVMWRGWNASGEWEPVTGRDALVAAAVYGAVAAAPVAIALVLLRRWVSLGAVLVALAALAVVTASSFESSTSSTAAFAWFGPLVIGLPLVGFVAIAEQVGAMAAQRSSVARSESASSSKARS